MKKLITTITVLILTLILIIVIISVFTPGGQREEVNEILADNYVNELYDYTFEFPDSWKDKEDKIRIFEGDYGRTVTFAYPFTCDQLDRGGKLMYQIFFTIAVMSQEEYEEELNDPPVVSNFITENNGKVYLIYTPLDNMILEKDTQEEYSELHLSLEEIIERFSLMDSNEETIDGGIKTDLADYYFEPSVSTIEGTLITRMHYGPPNYGENPETDEKLYPFILQLDNPIDVIALEDDIHNSDKFEVTEIQVAATREQIEQLKGYKNKRIKIQGTLFEALVGRHFTDVLISVDEILDTPYNEFITNLESMGFNVVSEDVGEDILQGQRKWLTINDNENISVYLYDSNEKMEEDASYIDEGGTSYNNGKDGTSYNNVKDATEISWVSYPHFYKKDNMIVLYVGEDLEIINVLKEIVGPQFAGHTE